MKKILISSLSLGVIIATGSPVFAKINFDSITKTQQEIVEKTAQPSQANSVASVNNIEPTQDVQSETEVTVPVTAESAQETIETKIATVTPGMTESMNTTEEIPSKDQSILPEVISSNDEIPSSESANTIDIEKTSELDNDQVSTEPQLTTESVDLALVKAELEELRAEKKSVDNELADAKNRLKKLFDNLDTGTQNALKELHRENEELNKYLSQAKNEKKDLIAQHKRDLAQAKKDGLKQAEADGIEAMRVLLELPSKLAKNELFRHFIESNKKNRDIFALTFGSQYLSDTQFELMAAKMLSNHCVVQQKASKCIPHEFLSSIWKKDAGFDLQFDYFIHDITPFKANN